MKCSLLTLSCYVDGELPAPRKGELEAHLVGCHRCRAGLGHLREEVERVQGLARVHLPETSVRLLLEQTRLIAAGDPMPAVPDAAAVAGPSESTPPWLRGGTGAALPWATARPPQMPRRPPAGLVPAPGGPVAPAAPPPSATPDTFDVWAAARVDAPPGTEPPSGPLPDGLPEPPPAEPPQSRAERRRARAEARQAAEAAEAAGAATAPAAEAGLETISTESPPEAPAPDIPSSTSDPATPGHPETAAAAVPPGGDAVPVWTPESSAETPPVARYPLTDEDALDEPTTVERFGPMPAPRPGVVDRLREKIALRRALRVAALDDRDDSIEIVSGPGAPMRGTRSRSDLARRRSEALRPAARPDGAAWEGEEGASTPVPERTGRREPTVDELLAPPARPSSLAGSAALPAPRPAPPDAETDEEWPAWRPEAEPEAPRRRRAGAAAAATASPGAAAPAGNARTIDGRRLTVVLGAAILLMFVVGVASARSTSPLPATSTSGTSGTQAPPAATVPQHPAVVPPAGPSAAPVPAAPHSSAALAGLTGTVTVGDGAPGWSVQGIRYGAHAGYLRMVFDLQPAAGAASGSPRATIGFQDPTTLIVSFDQATAPGAPAAPLAGGLVTSVSLLTPPPSAGSTAYVVRLAHAVQFTPSFASGPLRLILDLH
ncbi:MAG TPA: zf-HC2 domain-containing protein [Candidatus Dormibacteraeota bacterium]